MGHAIYPIPKQQNQIFPLRNSHLLITITNNILLSLIARDNILVAESAI
jgi:hypothetical protein